MTTRETSRPLFTIHAVAPDGTRFQGETIGGRALFERLISLQQERYTDIQVDDFPFPGMTFRPPLAIPSIPPFFQRGAPKGPRR